MDKKTINLEESKVKQLVSEGITEVLKEIEIPAETNIFYNKGYISLIIEEIKAFEEYEEKRVQIEELNKKYISMGNEYPQEDEVSKYYRETYMRLKGILDEKIEELRGTVIEPFEDKLDNELTAWGGKRFPEYSKSKHEDLYPSMFYGQQ